MPRYGNPRPVAEIAVALHDAIKYFEGLGVSLMRGRIRVYADALELLAAIRAEGGTCAKADAPMLLARVLGFARTGASITATVDSILRSLVRAGLVESRAGEVRVLRQKA